jgi:hypothetical protein
MSEHSLALLAVALLAIALIACEATLTSTVAPMAVPTSTNTVTSTSINTALLPYFFTVTQILGAGSATELWLDAGNGYVWPETAWYAANATKPGTIPERSWPILEGGRYLGGTLRREEFYADDGR